MTWEGQQNRVKVSYAKSKDGWLYPEYHGARAVSYTHLNNNPILKWCLTNTGVQTDRNGNITPVKNQAAKQRIDGMASLLDAYVGLTEKYNEFISAL